MNIKSQNYHEADIIDAVNRGRPDAYGILRNPADHRPCLICMGRFLPLACFSLCLRREDGELFEADIGTMDYQLALRVDPDVPASACLVLLDQQENVLLSSERDIFSGQIWLVGETPVVNRPVTLHGVFGYEQGRTIGSLLRDKSPILAAHWKVSAQSLQPALCQEGQNEGHF